VEAYIRAIAYALPESVLTNEELAQEYQTWTAEKIKAKTGIVTRHIVDSNECASDLAFQAATKLFQDNDVKPEDIDFLLLATESPDYVLPPTACILQHRLNIPTTAGALDFNLGCSAYVYGLALAKGLIASSVARNVLLLTAETYSRYINKGDKSTRTLFGDAATATWVSNNGSDRIGDFTLGTDGSKFSNLIVPAGGAKLVSSPETAVESQDADGYIRSQNNLFMDGMEVYNFTLERVPPAVKDVLDRNQLAMEDIDYFVFHQANQYIMEFLRKKLNIPSEKFIIELEDVGNTVSNTIPIALRRMQEKNLIMKGQKLLLLGFGVGLSWGAVVVYIE
jgi:3-oxoacyl-[acyl-carrier-protein] synthase-3